MKKKESIEGKHKGVTLISQVNFNLLFYNSKFGGTQYVGVCALAIYPSVFDSLLCILFS